METDHGTETGERVRIPFIDVFYETGAEVQSQDGIKRQLGDPGLMPDRALIEDQDRMIAMKTSGLRPWRMPAAALPRQIAGIQGSKPSTSCR